MRVIRVLLLSILAALLSASLAAAVEMESFYIKDPVVNRGYSVSDLYSGNRQSFGYEVPENGVTVLMFFGGQCSKSTQTLKMFAESQWIDHDYVNFYAVESSNTAQATVQHQLEVAAGKNASKFHPVLGGNPFLFQYVHQVFPDHGSIAYPFVLLITKVGDTPYIRYASEDLQTLDFYSDAIETLLAEHYETVGNLVYRIGEFSAEVVGYSGSPTDLEIPPIVQGLPVTSIARGALQGCTSLTSITVYPTTASVGAYAFADCPNLYRANISQCLWDLPEGLFSGCSSLAVCEMTDSTVFAIGKSAFEGCSQLQAILGWNALGTLAIIRDSAFSGCRSLSITIPATVQLLGNQAFAGSGLTAATLPAGLRSLGTGVFQNCTSLKSAAVKSALTTLPQNTFSGCTALQSATLPIGLTTIGREAFKNCSALSSVSLPETLTDLEREAFAGSGLTAVTVPDSVSAIDYAAFRDCSNLTSAALPETLPQLPESLFSYCTSLTDLSLPEGLTELPPTLFEFCSALTSIQIPEGVTSIGRSAFSHCRSLAAVSLPDDLERIGGYAFAHCGTLSTVVLPAGLTSMEDNCFFGCDDLSAAYFRGNAPSEFGRNVFDDCRYDFTIYYTEGTHSWADSNAYDSTDKTWNGYPLVLWKTVISGPCGPKGNENRAIWTLDMDTGIFTVSGSGPMADILWEFQYREDLYAYRPDWYAYRDFIRTLKVEEGITHLGAGTFYQFPALTSVTLPASIASVGNRAFDGCGALSTVCFSGNAPETIGSYIFRGCTDDFTILYPDGAAGWTSPLWNGWPAAHSVQKDGVLTHCAAVPTGTRAILVTFGDNGRMLSCSSVIWDKSPLVTLPLPASREAVSMQLFYLNSASAPFRAENDLTDFVL